MSAQASLREELSFRFKKPETLSLGTAIAIPTTSYSPWTDRKAHHEKNEEIIKWCREHGWNEGATVVRRVLYSQLAHDNNREWGTIIRHYTYAPEGKVITVRWGGNWNDLDYQPEDLILLNPAAPMSFMRQRIAEALKT